MKKTFALASAALLAAGASQAEGTFVGDVTLGFSSGEMSISGLGSQDIDTPSIKMHSTITLSDNFEFDLNLGSRVSDASGTGLELDSTYIAVAPRYTFENGLILGAYFDKVDNGTNLLPIDLGGSSAGLSLGKDYGNWDFEVFAGISDLDLLDTIFLGGISVDIRDIGLRGGFQVNDDFHLGGHFIYTDIDVSTPGPSVSLGVYSIGLGGQYLINDRFAVFGALSRQWMDETIAPVSFDASGTRYALGASYAFGGSGSGMPMVASLELVRTDLDGSLTSPGPSGNADGNYDEVRLGLTIPLGHKGRSTPLNSTYREVSGGGHTAVAHLLGLY